jgi:hypothetical protein
MPPKRSLKEESSDEGTNSSSESSPSPSPAIHDGLVACYADLFSGLPHDAVVSQAVGVATRLIARLSALSHLTVTGDVRVYRDCIRFVRKAVALIRPAACELAGLELALLASLSRLTAELDAATTPARRRARRH